MFPRFCQKLTVSRAATTLTVSYTAQHNVKDSAAVVSYLCLNSYEGIRLFADDDVH